jgi:hypothetical protein
MMTDIPARVKGGNFSPRVSWEGRMKRDRFSLDPDSLILPRFGNGLLSLGRTRTSQAKRSSSDSIASRKTGSSRG